MESPSPKEYHQKPEMNDEQTALNHSPTPPSSQDLPTGYYLDHFLTFLDTVDSRYGDLLSSDEHAFISAFRRLPLSPQRLYVRLISRQGPLFRSDRLAYPEIPDLETAWKTLSEQNFLAIASPELSTAALPLLTIPELRQLAAESGIGLQGGAKKADILGAISEHLPPAILAPVLRRRFLWLSPGFPEIMRVFRLLFFGTSEPDLTAFVLSDLGKIRFEPYPLLSTHRLFTRRDEIERALLLIDLAEELHVLLDLPMSTEQAEGIAGLIRRLPATDGHPILTRRRRRFLEKAGRHWERQGRPDIALELYADPSTWPSRERRARLLARAGLPPQALDVCQEILKNPRHPEEEEVAANLAARLQSATPPATGLDPIVEKWPLPPEPGIRVEERVLRLFSQKGLPGFEAENRFWTSLFALLFWDIIFSPVPRAFGHPFQSGPSDLFSAGFRPAREPAISKRLAELASTDDWRDRLLERYHQKHGIANALVTWEALPIHHFSKAVQVIPGSHLAAICDRLSQNPGGFKTGFPDLFLFTSNPCGYLLAEVKSPNDRLQNNQKSWMRFFSRHGIPCRVIQVVSDEPPQNCTKA
jgi:hypothetical protein